jgi:AcrR family transcriptional regulator
MTDDTRTLLLDTVERMCASMPPSEVTMRRLAAEADVSVGLAYHYFDSKDDMFGSVLDRLAADIARSIDPDLGSGEVLREVWIRLRAAPAFARLIAWLILEGKDVSAVMSGHPLMAQIAAQAGEKGNEHPPTAAATLILLALAGGFFGAPANRAIGRDNDDPALFEVLAGLLDEHTESPAG